MNHKNVVITGATSFISTALMRRLLKEDISCIFAVVALDSSRKEKLCFSDRIQIIESDLADIDRITLEKNMPIDAIFHIGWSSRFENSRYNLEGQMQNVTYLEKVILLAQKMGCQKIIGVGSQAECGRVFQPISESTVDHPETAYGIAKCVAYEKGMELCQKYGIRFFWPRILSAYGPDDKLHTFIMSCLNAAVYNKEILLTKCEQIWDYIYVDDVADALVRIAEQGTPGVKYTVASGQAKKLEKYLFEIAEITENPSLVKAVGKKEYADAQVMYLVGDISKLREDTGFTPKISFKEGIKETIARNFR